MPIVPVVRYKWTVEELVSAALRLRWTSVQPGRVDRLRYAFTVANFIETAAEPVRFIGVIIEMDDGSGNLVVVPGCDRDGEGAEITLSRTLDGFGVAELSFSVYGEHQSLWRNPGYLRAMRRVRVRGVTGVPGLYGERVLFDGWIRDAEFDAFPGRARFRCQDVSLEHVDKKLFFNLDPGQQRTRLDVILEVLNDNSFPIGVIDLPDEDGGVLVKAISEGGDKRITVWLPELVAAVGRYVRWRDNAICIEELTASKPPVRTFGPGDIRSLRQIPAPTNAPNRVAMSASLYEYLGPTGTRTEPPVEVVDETPYTPKVAVTKQETGGALIPLSITPVTATPTSKTITTTTKSGGTIIHQEIDEYGWIAPLVCNKRQAFGTGAVSYNNVFECYQYADGTWRLTPTEEFRLLRRTVITRSFDANGYLREERRAVTRYQALRRPLGEWTAAASTLPYDVLITETGEAWDGGQEQFAADPTISIGYISDESGVLTVIGAFYFMSFPRLRAATPTGPVSPTIYYYGPYSAIQYATAAQATVFDAGVGPRSKITFQVVDETKHRRVCVVTEDNDTFEGQFLPAIFPHGTTEFPGPIPSNEQHTDSQTAQQATVVVIDEVRTALARGIEISEPRSNDYCETPGELRRAGGEFLREFAPTIEITSDWDMTTDVGDVVRVDHPKLGPQPVDLPVVGISASMNSDGQNSQVLSCPWYPPELATL